ncbi:MAG TPA: hypothetical protein VMZ69_04470, partial [Saprospiraceae bacterium]|nr:hypothetical protein [Saprospiraceae bacterium]
VPFEDKRGYGHTGGIDGFSSAFYYFPDDKVSFALTSNGSNFNNNEIAIAVLSSAFGRPYSIPEFKTYTCTPEQLEPFVGTYSSAGFPLKIMISRQENILWAQAVGQPSFPLEATGPSSFQFDQAGIKLEFSATDKKMVLKQGGGEYTFIKE